MTVQGPSCWLRGVMKSESRGEHRGRRTQQFERKTVGDGKVAKRVGENAAQGQYNMGNKSAPYRKDATNRGKSTKIGNEKRFLRRVRRRLRVYTIEGRGLPSTEIVMNIRVFH